MWNVENDKWLMHIVTECYFDTVLIKSILGIGIKKRINHQRSCNEVVKVLKVNALKDSFAIAMVDKDKTELDFLKKDCEQIEGINEKVKIILWQRKTPKQIIFQLNPPLENWIKEILKEDGKSVKDFGYSEEPRKLKKEIKYDIDNENNSRLNKLVNTIIDSNSKSIIVLKQTLTYLIEKNYKSDINELKEIII